MKWQNFTAVIGSLQSSEVFNNFVVEIKEFPYVSISSLGDVTYYSFFNSGILLLIENLRLTQITFFIEELEGFSKYYGDLIIDANSSEQDIVKQLGNLAFSGGGYPDAFLGYINRWIKYEEDAYFLHFELNASNKIAKVSLIGKE
jgi:hypothetical protein